MKNLKKTNVLSFIFLLTLTGLLLTSCGQLQSLQDTKTDVCTVTFFATNSRQANPVSLDAEKLFYTLSYYQAENIENKRIIGEEEPISYRALTSARLELEEGVWTFELTAFSNTQAALSASVTKEIVKGNNSITFALKETEYGTGSIDVTLSFPSDNAVISKISAVLYDFYSNKVILAEKRLYPVPAENEGYYSVNYKTDVSEPIEKGMYILYFTFYGDTSGTLIIGTYPELVVVAPGTVSKSSPTTNDITKTYSITYNNMTAEDGTSYWTKTDTIPLTFNAYKTIILPLADTVQRKGYVFEGWYDNADFDGEPLSEISAGTENNVILYAKWERKKVEPAIIFEPKSIYKAGDTIELSASDEYGDIVKNSITWTAEMYYDGEIIENAVVITENELSIKLTDKNGTCQLKLTASFKDTQISNTFDIMMASTISITAENSIEIITNLSENANVYVTGEIGVNDILNIKSALRELYSPNNDIRVSLDLSETTGLLSIASEAFSYCTALSEVILPDTVTSIGSSAFSNCENLESITIREGLLSIGDSAFYGCHSLKTAILPEGLISIGNGVFYTCRALEYASIPSTVQTIGIGSFEECSSLEEVSFKASVLLVPEKTFFRCSSLREISIPEGIKEIQDYAFYSCNNLEAVSLPSTLTTIGENAFRECAFKNIDIPKNVNSIGNYAFHNCDSLLTVVIPEGIETIETGTFSTCSSLAKVTIPTSVTTIGNDAFSTCTALADIKIPESVTRIEYGAFQYCSALATISIPDTVKTIGERTFGDCDSLAYVKLPNGLETIEKMTFYKCKALASITIPNTVTKICNMAFEGCNSLASVTIPASVLKLGENASYDYGYSVFYECTLLSEVIFENISGWIEIDDNIEKGSIDVTDPAQNAELLKQIYICLNRTTE